MRRYIFVGLATLLLGAGQAAAKCTVAKADIPVTMEGMTAIVPATINGKNARLQLDSGAFFSVIDEDAAKSAGLRLSPAGFDAAGLGGRVAAQMTSVRQFALAGIDGGRNKAFVVVPYSHGGLAVGLLGEDILGSYDVEYDLTNGLIRLMKIDNCGDNLAYWSDGSQLSTLPIEPLGPGHTHIVGTVLVNGQRMRAMFDTGVAHSAISRRGAERAGVRPTDTGVAASNAIGGLGRRVRESWTGTFAEVQIGDEKIRNTQLTIVEKTVADWDMLIGADFFLSHRILVARSKSRMYFTYSGGPVFRLDGPPPAVIGAAPPPAETTSRGVLDNAPHDAAGFNRRGDAKLARRDFQGAFTDFDKGIALESGDAGAYFDRARAHWGLKQQDAAMADLEKALALRPAFTEALLWRADIEVDQGHTAKVEADLAAATKAGQDDWTAQLVAARLYARIKQYDKGIALLDRLIASKPDDSPLSEALLMRSRLRTREGGDLNLALADCNAVLKLRGPSAELFEQRGLVRLRRGETALAVTDFDAALKLQPKMAAALVGRATAERRLGQAVEADADLQAARLLNPKTDKPAGED